MKKDILTGIITGVISLILLIVFVGNDVASQAKYEKKVKDKEVSDFVEQYRLDEIERIKKSGRTR